MLDFIRYIHHHACDDQRRAKLNGTLKSLITIAYYKHVILLKQLPDSIRCAGSYADLAFSANDLVRISVYECGSYGIDNILERNISLKKSSCIKSIHISHGYILDGYDALKSTFLVSNRKSGNIPDAHEIPSLTYAGIRADAALLSYVKVSYLRMHVEAKSRYCKSESVEHKAGLGAYHTGTAGLIYCLTLSVATPETLVSHLIHKIRISNGRTYRIRIRILVSYDVNLLLFFLLNEHLWLTPALLVVLGCPKCLCFRLTLLTYLIPA